LVLKEQETNKQELEKYSKQMLEEEVPALQKFFYELYDALVKGCDQLQLASPQETLLAIQQ